MANKGVPQLPASNLPELEHIPTLPFGTKGVNAPLAKFKGPAREKEFNPFRFVVSEPPAGIIERLLSTPSSSSAVAPAAARASRSHWLFLLGAVVLVLFTFTLLIWPDTNVSEELTRPREPSPASQHLPQHSPARAEVATDRKPVTAVNEAPNTVETLAVIAARREPDAATRRQTATNTRLAVSTASTTLKKGSALRSVLAPPPVD